MVEVVQIASATMVVGGGCALAANSFINGEGEGGGVIMCNRNTDGASVDEKWSESESEMEASVREFVVDDIVSV